MLGTHPSSIAIFLQVVNSQLILSAAIPVVVSMALLKIDWIPTQVIREEVIPKTSNMIVT